MVIFFYVWPLRFKMVFAERKITSLSIGGDKWQWQMPGILLLKISHKLCQGSGVSVSFSLICCCWSSIKNLFTQHLPVFLRIVLRMYLFKGYESENLTYFILLHPIQGCRVYMQTLECLAVKRNVTKLRVWPSWVCTGLGWEFYFFN